MKEATLLLLLLISFLILTILILLIINISSAAAAAATTIKTYLASTFMSKHSLPLTSPLPCNVKLAVTRFDRAKRDRIDREECVFCLTNIEDGEEVRELKCKHVFHKNCLDGWVVRRQSTCPICRDNFAAVELKVTLPETEEGEEEEDWVLLLVAYVCSGWFFADSILDVVSSLRQCRFC